MTTEQEQRIGEFRRLPGFAGWIALPELNPFRPLTVGGLRHKALSPLVNEGDVIGTVYAVMRHGGSNMAVKVWPDGAAVWLPETKGG